MFTPKTSIELRSEDYDPNIAKKYKGLSLRKAKELSISDELLERIFNIICRHPFYGKINPNFTETTRNVVASVARSTFDEINRFHGEGTSEEAISYEFIFEFTRKLIFEVKSLAQVKTVQYKRDGLFSDKDLLSDLMKKALSENIVIVSPLIGNIMMANGVIGDSPSLPELMLVPTNLSNVYVDTCAVVDSVLTFNPSKVVFDFSEIVMFPHIRNKPEDSDPNFIRIEGGIHPRIEAYNANINETIYQLLDISKSPVAEVFGWLLKGHVVSFSKQKGST